MCTHNQCFRAKIRKNVYPCTPQFYYTKVGCKGVFVTRTCFRDEQSFITLNFRVFLCIYSTQNKTFPTPGSQMTEILI